MAIWPAGPPNDTKPSLSQKRAASEKGTLPFSSGPPQNIPELPGSAGGSAVREAMKSPVIISSYDCPGPTIG